jgi:hypothetical protein
MCYWWVTPTTLAFATLAPQEQQHIEQLCNLVLELTLWTNKRVTLKNK